MAGTPRCKEYSYRYQYRPLCIFEYSDRIGACPYRLFSLFQSCFFSVPFPHQTYNFVGNCRSVPVSPGDLEGVTSSFVVTLFEWRKLAMCDLKQSAKVGGWSCISGRSCCRLEKVAARLWCEYLMMWWFNVVTCWLENMHLFLSLTRDTVFSKLFCCWICRQCSATVLHKCRVNQRAGSCSYWQCFYTTRDFVWDNTELLFMIFYSILVQ